MRGTRALVALVVAMGVLIVVGTTGLIVVIVHRLAHPHPTTVPAVMSPAVSGSGEAALRSEPAGTRITSIIRQSDSLLAIALTGGGADRVLVWDLTAGRALTEIRLAP
jgi:hypothetical protein